MSTYDWDLLSSYAGLLSLAAFSIYTGSFGSLPVRVYLSLCGRRVLIDRTTGTKGEGQGDEYEPKKGQRIHKTACETISQLVDDV